jgi:hypothetical protein
VQDEHGRSWGAMQLEQTTVNDHVNDGHVPLRVAVP